MSDESTRSTYTYERTLTRAFNHARRYPRHYGALALWLVAMLLLPNVVSQPANVGATPASSASTGGAVLDADDASTEQMTDVLATAADALGLPSPRPVSVGSVGSSVPMGPAGSGSSSPPSSPTPAGPADEGEEEETPATPVPVPATPEVVQIPPPPALPLPAVPEELQPLVAAVSPLTTQGCSAVGLAAVVAAVAGPAAGDAVPVADIMPYLAPAYSLCATFPQAEGDRTICAIDEQMHAAGYPADVSGLVKTPNVIGIGVDVIAGFERAVAQMTGTELGLAAALGDALGCHPEEA